MKLLIEVEAPGIEQLTPKNSGYEQDIEKEIAAFVSLLVKSRLKHTPKVSVLIAGTGAVLVDANQLLNLQAKATALRRIVECEDREICAALENASKLVGQS